MNYPDEHPSQEVRNALVKLSDVLCQWERATGRRNTLIYRELGGFTYRCMDGKPVPQDDNDVTDEMLFAASREQTP